ncbi:TPA: hypothetical protein ACXPT9_005444 [Bacillus cereus]
MRYFEFDKHEYWALVAAENTEKAFDVYTEIVAGESGDQVREEGVPTEITKKQARRKYVDALLSTTSSALDEIILGFNQRKNDVVLIESSVA